MDATNGRMTRWEYDELSKLARAREKAAKAAAEQRAAELLADFETKLASTYDFDDQHWNDLTQAAERVVAEADAEIAERCRKLGIPERFRPQLTLSWYSRGENASKHRRAELRKVAERHVEALEKRARTEIATRTVEVQTALLAGNLDSAAAKAFLESIPMPEALMPRLEVRDVEAMHLKQAERRTIA